MIKRQVKKIPQYLTNCLIPTETNGYKPYALGPKALSTYSAILIFIKVAVSLLFVFYPNLAYLSDVTPNKLISLTNQSRQALGLTPLTVNSKLTTAAQNKAQDMLEKDYFAHTSKDGTTPWKWIKDAGYHYLYAGENLAMDFISAEAVHNAWMASESHKANILSSNFSEIGLAVLCGEFKEKDTCIVVQMFGAQTASQTNELISTITPKPETQPSQELIQVKKFLSPSADNTPPEPPQIIFPKNDSFITTSTPTVSGKAEPNSNIIIFINNKEIDKTKTSDDGNFSYAISNLTPLKDGNYELKVQAQDEALNISQPSDILKFIVDTQPPIIDIANSYVTFNKEEKTLDIFAYVQENPEKVLALINKDQIELTNNFGLWTSNIKLTDGFPPSVEIEAQDQAGNSIKVPLPTQGKIQSAFIGPAHTLSQSLSVKAYQISKKIYLGALAFLICALALNIFIKIKIQHPKTIVFSLLLCGLTILLLLI